MIGASQAYRARILDQFTDPAVQKIIVMRWWSLRHISGDQAEQLILGRGIATA